MTTYKCWYDMLRRCNNPKSTSYARYGAVGIRVCDRWHVFENFLADMGHRPDGATLDRFPNQKGNYEPGNVRWATGNQQQTNQINNNKNAEGQLWRHKALANGISPALLHRRVYTHGWSWEKAASQPPDQNRTGSTKAKQNNNTSGYTGVFFRKDRGYFVARINYKGRLYSLGTFLTAEDARDAYLDKEKQLIGG